MTLKKLTEHKKNHGERIFKCETCSKGLRGKRALLNHNVQHETFTCSKCKQVFLKNNKSTHSKKRYVQVFSINI